MARAETSPSSTLLYQGDLAQTPLPEILIKVHRYKVPGTIECRRGDELKRIYVDPGDIILATTSRISESLGDMLLREGRITRAQYDESVALLRATGKRHGVVLAEMQILTSDELFAAVRRQLLEVVRSLFAWDFGQVTFAPGREKHTEFVRTELPIPQAIVHGVRSMPDARAIVERLGTRLTLFARTLEQPVGLGEDEWRLLERVDGRRTLFDLVGTPPLSQADNARVLYALATLGLITTVSPRHVKVQVRTDGKPARA